MKLGWMACVAVKVYGVGGANTSAKEVKKLLYRKTIRIPFGTGCNITGTWRMSVNFRLKGELIMQSISKA
ncbi:hypothetical protein [Peribacillus simplex]|uniref:hypothetical protein n=1 Tax=Peribacillus simplex TaxID=1478 RepID=UPI00367062D8